MCKWCYYILNKPLVLLLQMLKVIHFLRHRILLFGKELPKTGCLKQHNATKALMNWAKDVVLLLYCLEKHRSKVDIY